MVYKISLLDPQPHTDLLAAPFSTVITIFVAQKTPEGLTYQAFYFAGLITLLVEKGKKIDELCVILNTEFMKLPFLIYFLFRHFSRMSVREIKMTFKRFPRDFHCFLYCLRTFFFCQFFDRIHGNLLL